MPPPEPYCLVCRRPVVGAACAHCGAIPAKVQAALGSAGPVRMPTLWQSLWGGRDFAWPTGEAVWAELSPDYQEAVLSEYRVTQRRGRALTNLVMFALAVAVLASCFWTGVRAGGWLGVGGGWLGEWLCGAGGVLLLTPLRLFPVGAYVEGLLLRRRGEVEARRALARFGLISAAVARRCRLPWHLNPDVLFPLAVAAVLAVGLLLV